MIRPEKKNYEMDGKLIASVYVPMLEEYCDELEQSYHTFTEALSSACLLLENCNKHMPFLTDEAKKYDLYGWMEKFLLSADIEDTEERVNFLISVVKDEYKR